ncbi:MAG TPA: FtsX-like permease family protein, partial [Blastocatellia bacterium]|nr:FtsX-like permease family protein [Blastocatellia bacterium]
PCCKDVRGMTFAVRTYADPLTLTAAVRQAVREADSRIPVTGITTEDRVVEQNVGQERTFATLCTGFAILALAIAGLGLYGTMAYTVARRTGEIGIRMALGAQRGDVLRLILREGVALVAVGLALGLVASLAATSLIERFLYGVRATDPLTYALIALVLAAVALLACYLPARRATKVDPMVALRYE